MPPPVSRRQSAAPCLPGAWRDSHLNDDTQDADVSSVSSKDSFVATVRARKDSGRKASRRWSYAGTTRAQSRIPPPIRTDLYKDRSQHGAANMSPVTDAVCSRESLPRSFAYGVICSFHPGLFR